MHERDHFLDDTRRIALHPAPVERMGAAVAERIAVVRVDAEHLDAPALDRRPDRRDDALRSYSHSSPPVVGKTIIGGPQWP